MDSHTKWVIGIGIALAGLIVAIAVLFDSRIDAVERQITEAKGNVTDAEIRLTTRLDDVDRRLIAAQTAANSALVVAAQNHRDNVQLVLEASAVPESEIVQILDNIPRNVGRLAEEVVEDIGDVLEDIADILDPF